MLANVLIVEDDWLIAEDHAGILRGAGYCVIGPCASVGSALAAIDGNSIHAALLDVDLRIEKSYPVALRLQQLGIPFLFISGKDEKDVAGELSSGNFLSKP